MWAQASETMSRPSRYHGHILERKEMISRSDVQGNGDDEPTYGEVFDASGKPGGQLEESSD